MVWFLWKGIWKGKRATFLHSTFICLGANSNFWIMYNVHLTINRYPLNDSSTENRVTGRTIYTPGITKHYSVISVYPASNQHNTLLNTCVIEITVYDHDWFIKLLRSLLKYLIWILELKIHQLQNIKNVVLLTLNTTSIKKVPWGTKKKQLLRVSEGDNYQILLKLSAYVITIKRFFTIR